jgi:hypothetical protein
LDVSIRTAPEKSTTVKMLTGLLQPSGGVVVLVAFCFGYLIYAVSTPEFESWALSSPVRMLRLLPVVAVAWYVPHHLGRSTTDVEKKLIFEESAARSVEVLTLSE